MISSAPHQPATRAQFRWMAVAMILICAYLAAQIIADITAVKMVTILGMFLPGGTLIYAFTFTLSDFVHRHIGKRMADSLVIVSGVVNIVMAIYFQWVVGIPRAPFWPEEAQAAFASTLGIVWTIVGSSIVAEMIAGLIDNGVYHLFENPWVGMVVSNLISVPIDSVVFVGLAFVGIPLLLGQGANEHALEIIRDQTFFKWGVGIVIMPIMALLRGSWKGNQVNQ